MVSVKLKNDYDIEFFERQKHQMGFLKKICKKVKKVGKKIDRKVVRPVTRPAAHAAGKFANSCNKRGIHVYAGTDKVSVSN